MPEKGTICGRKKGALLGNWGWRKASWACPKAWVPVSVFVYFCIFSRGPSRPNPWLVTMPTNAGSNTSSPLQAAFLFNWNPPDSSAEGREHKAKLCFAFRGHESISALTKLKVKIKVGFGQATPASQRPKLPPQKGRTHSRRSRGAEWLDANRATVPGHRELGVAREQTGSLRNPGRKGSLMRGLV